jgi:hypothetical protein
MNIHSIILITYLKLISKSSDPYNRSRNDYPIPIKNFLDNAVETIFEYELKNSNNNNPERIAYLRILATKSSPIRTNIIRNSQIKMQERRNKSVIKRNRGRPKEVRNMKNI